MKDWKKVRKAEAASEPKQDHIRRRTKRNAKRKYKKMIGMPSFTEWLRVTMADVRYKEAQRIQLQLPALPYEAEPETTDTEFTDTPCVIDLLGETDEE